jgi:hypothetical protein
MAEKNFEALVAALGGVDNINAANSNGSTFIASVKDLDLVDMTADGVDLTVQAGAIEATPGFAEAKARATMINLQK